MGAVDMVTLLCVYVKNMFPKYKYYFHFETKYA